MWFEVPVAVNQKSISRTFGTRNKFKDASLIKTPFSHLTESRTIAFNLIRERIDAHLSLWMGR